LISHLLNTYSRNLDYAKRLVADVPEDKMAHQPAPGMNHPAWVIGHLALVGDMIGGLMGQAPLAPAAWEPIFGNSSKPSADASIYPGKAELVAALERSHARIASIVSGLPPEALAQTMPKEEYRKHFPTTGDALMYIMTFHDGVHLGQLSAWRRVQGMPSV